MVEQQRRKRLIEVAFPLEEVSAHSRREKNVRHGHISTLHIWWARRPLAACRAFIPKHGSWLNMAEIELGVLTRQCLDRRIPAGRS